MVASTMQMTCQDAAMLQRVLGPMLMLTVVCRSDMWESALDHRVWLGLGTPRMAYAGEFQIRHQTLRHTMLRVLVQMILKVFGTVYETQKVSHKCWAQASHLAQVLLCLAQASPYLLHLPWVSLCLLTLAGAVESMADRESQISALMMAWQGAVEVRPQRHQDHHRTMLVWLKLTAACFDSTERYLRHTRTVQKLMET